MSSISSTNSKFTGTVMVGGVNFPNIINSTTDVTPGLETSIALPANTKQFRITNRGTHIVKLSYTVSGSGSIYLTLFPNAPYTEQNIVASSVTFYVQSTGISQRIEIVSWS